MPHERRREHAERSRGLLDIDRLLRGGGGGGVGGGIGGLLLCGSCCGFLLGGCRGGWHGVASLDLREGQTRAPSHLSESELIGMMERQGIGTDASISTHIQNIQNRRYASLGNGRQLVGPWDAVY